jgi:hypothetical protein
MRLRTVGDNIPQHAFAVRKAYLADAFEKGKYLKNPNANKETATPANPMTDPEMMEGMMEGMKKQLMNMVPQMIIMGWINFFFQGFVVSKYKSIKKEDPHLCINSLISQTSFPFNTSF